jgi:hypothetical protein
MATSKGSEAKRVGASASSHTLREQRIKRKRNRSLLSKLLSVVLAVNMALMFALPATIFADNPTSDAADTYVAISAPSPDDVVFGDPAPSDGADSSDSTPSGQEVTIEQPAADSIPSDASVNGGTTVTLPDTSANGDTPVTTLDGDVPVFAGDPDLGGGASPHLMSAM